MARAYWTGLCGILLCLLGGMAYADEDETALDMAFLEFLAEAKKVDGEYHDPLQMQDWTPNNVVETGQQQEDKDHE